MNIHSIKPIKVSRWNVLVKYYDIEQLSPTVNWTYPTLTHWVQQAGHSASGSKIQGKFIKVEINVVYNMYQGTWSFNSFSWLQWTMVRANVWKEKIWSSSEITHAVTTNENSYCSTELQALHKRHVPWSKTQLVHIVMCLKSFPFPDKGSL